MFSLSRLGHRFKQALVITGDEARLFRTDLRLVARDPDVDLRRLRTELEVHEQREVRISDSASAEHFKLVEASQFFKHVKMNVVETSIKDRSPAVFTLNLRQRITAIRQHFAFGTKCFRYKVFPRSAVEQHTKWQRIQKQPE